MQNLTFDSLPHTIAKIFDKVNNIEQLLSTPVVNSNFEPLKDRWLSVDELIEYLPGKTSKSTIYAKTHKREIPHKKFGSRLAFLTSEIDAYLQTLNRKTASETAIIAEAFVESNRRRGTK